MDTTDGTVGYVAIDLSDLEPDPYVFLDLGPGSENLLGARPGNLKLVSPLEALASAGE